MSARSGVTTPAPSPCSYLTPADCLPLLLRLGLISPAAVVRGEVTVEDTSSRNSNRRVSRTRGAHYLLKQTTGSGHHATVEREALVYSFLSKAPRLAPHLPRFYRYNSCDGVLILEHLRGMHDLAQHYAKGGRVTLAVARRVGGILGALHRLDAGALPGKLALPAESPWILSVHLPSLRTIRELSAANLELIR